MALLRLEAIFHRSLWDHLLPVETSKEQGAFLHCVVSERREQIEFNVVDQAFLTGQDFVAQETDYLELADATRVRLIKRAHQLGASLVELHSHPGPWPAGFSFSDRLGLKETVRHMWWRLKGRPYMAIVVAPSGFDALLWRDDPRVPEALDGILIGDRLLTPTNTSLGGWDHDE